MAERYACPCCGFLTLTEPGDNTYEICQVCFWEVDGVQSDDPDYRGGANAVSLKARANFARFRASEERFLKFVRAPNDEERLSS